MIELRRRSSRPAATLMKESASESMEIRQHTPLAVTGSSSVSFSFLLPSCAFLSSQNSPSRPFDLPAATFLLHQPSRSYLSCLVSLAVVHSFLPSAAPLPRFLSCLAKTSRLVRPSSSRWFLPLQLSFFLSLSRFSVVKFYLSPLPWLRLLPFLFIWGTQP